MARGGAGFSGEMAVLARAQRGQSGGATASPPFSLLPLTAYTVRALCSLSYFFPRCTVAREGKGVSWKGDHFRG